MLTELTFCHKSSTNIWIDNRYYNRFIQLGKPIFPVKYNGAALFTIPTTFEIAHARVTLASHRSPNLRPESDHRYSTARCFYCSVNPLRLHLQFCHFFLLAVVIAGDCAMTLAFHMLRKICPIKNIITIYFHIWT